MEDNFLFEKEIRIFGLRRSGLHATYGWINRHFPKGTCMYQDNTYFSFREKKTNMTEFDDKFKLLKNPRYYINIVEQQRLPDVANKLNNPNHTYNTEKKAIVDRYEKEYLSKKEYNIIVLRNPFSTLASTILRKLDSKTFNDMWKAYAKEFIGITDYFDYKTLCLFDEWFSNIEYRKALSKSLDLKFSDKGLNTVLSRSSFDRWKFSDKAQEMNVLDRWDQLSPEVRKKYYHIIDEEIIDLWETVLKNT